jgi:hypothetical protein
MTKYCRNHSSEHHTPPPQAAHRWSMHAGQHCADTQLNPSLKPTKCWVWGIGARRTTVCLLWQTCMYNTHVWDSTSHSQPARHHPTAAMHQHTADPTSCPASGCVRPQACQLRACDAEDICRIVAGVWPAPATTTRDCPAAAAAAPSQPGGQPALRILCAFNCSSTTTSRATGHKSRLGTGQHRGGATRHADRHQLPPQPTKCSGHNTPQGNEGLKQLVMQAISACGVWRGRLVVCCYAP